MAAKAFWKQGWLKADQPPVSVAKRSCDADAEDAAHRAVDQVKHALGDGCTVLERLQPVHDTQHAVHRLVQEFQQSGHDMRA